MNYPISNAVLGRHIAVVGETGSGKTHDTKSIVEHLVAQGHRVCVLDTIKSDWWGVISSASGKKAGLPFRIIGGPRGHVPLHAGAGKVLGELVGKGKLPLSIIDMADFDMGEPQAFFVDFAKALWKHTKGVLYLVIEEAHEIAPKERAGFGKENMAVFWAKRLATGSRTKGIRLIVATQRTQALHNAVLGSCAVLIAHSLSFPADQKPVLEWLNNNIKDKALRTTIAEEMAELPTGTAWAACPKEKFFEKIHFPAIKTFDNSATPDKDAADIAVTTAAVDPEELRAILGDAVKEAEANDPAALKKEVARLTGELAKAAKSPATRAVPISSAIDEKARAKAIETIVAEARKQAADAVQAQIPAMLDVQHQASFRAGFEFLAARRALFEDSFIPERKSISAITAVLKAKLPSAQIMAITVPASGKLVAPIVPASRPSGAPATLDGPLQRIVDAIRYWNVFGIERPTHHQVAFIANYVPGSGTWNRYLSSLRSSSMLEPRGDLKLTAEGEAVARDPEREPSGEQLRRDVIAKIDGPLVRILQPLIDAYPDAMDHQSLAERANYVAGSGTWNRYLSSLRSLDLIEKRGDLKAQAWLFP